MAEEAVVCEACASAQVVVTELQVQKLPQDLMNYRAFSATCLACGYSWIIEEDDEDA